MEKMLKAILKSEIKKVGENEYEFAMSDETIDRDGEVIKVDGWDLKNFKKNNILLWGHRHDIPGIGVVGLAVKEDGNLVAKKVRFASEGIYELADTVHGLVDDKVLKAVSVGYIPKKRTYPADEDDDKGTKGKKKPRVITEEAELYELSIVNVGSNPNALAVLKSAEQKAENNPPEAWFNEKTWNEMFKKNGIEEVSEKPYPNEHACRLKPPNYDKYARRACYKKHDGKCIDFIFGIKGENESELQAMRYKKNIWDVADARAHCKEHEGTFEAASENSIMELIDRLEKKVDEVCEMVKTMTKPKRRYDGLFAGDSKSESEQPTHTLEDKQNPFAEEEPVKIFKKEQEQ